jgi:hypothetical protein
VRLGRAPRTATPQAAPAPVAPATAPPAQAASEKYPAAWSRDIQPVTTDGTTYDARD